MVVLITMAVKDKVSTIGNIPSLKRRPKFFLEINIQVYKSATRQGIPRNRVMTEIEDQHITLLADYINSIK